MKGKGKGKGRRERKGKGKGKGKEYGNIPNEGKDGEGRNIDAAEGEFKANRGKVVEQILEFKIPLSGIKNTQGILIAYIKPICSAHGKTMEDVIIIISFPLF